MVVSSDNKFYCNAFLRQIILYVISERKIVTVQKQINSKMQMPLITHY
jgi:hypothetical protein